MQINPIHYSKHSAENTPHPHYFIRHPSPRRNPQHTQILAKIHYFNLTPGLPPTNSLDGSRDIRVQYRGNNARTADDNIEEGARKMSYIIPQFDVSGDILRRELSSGCPCCCVSRIRGRLCDNTHLHTLILETQQQSTYPPDSSRRKISPDTSNCGMIYDISRAPPPSILSSAVRALFRAELHSDVPRTIQGLVLVVDLVSNGSNGSLRGCLMK
ncbi:hypothetical protein CDAR_590761 [Caerostris darwini]|uniref:Uncharacterized protein n=1 Tax=Caerostris darwini TaxID=1538125 RepID=A0AAV4VXH1_9ARAC|nr:hypothetical protein CDAR_590761 [Caerostris darwini]